MSSNSPASNTQTIASGGTWPTGMRANAAQAVAPAGGTGATEGAYDTSTNRDACIALINEMRTALIAAGIIKGSA
jgi:hypothetical protein